MAQCTLNRPLVHCSFFAHTFFYLIIIIFIMTSIFFGIRRRVCRPPSSSQCEAEKVMPYANDATNIAIAACRQYSVSLRRNKTLSIGRRTKMSHIHICRRRHQRVWLFFPFFCFRLEAARICIEKWPSIFISYSVTLRETQYFLSLFLSLSPPASLPMCHRCLTSSSFAHICASQMPVSQM